MSMQATSQLSCGTNAQLPSDIFKMLPRMSSNNRDVLTLFVHVNVLLRLRVLIDRDGMNLCPLICLRWQ